MSTGLSTPPRQSAVISSTGFMTHSVGTSVQTRPNVRNRTLTSMNSRRRKNQSNVRYPSEGVRTDGSGRLTDVSDKTGENRLKMQGQSDFSDDWTGRTPPPTETVRCRANDPCGRPAPVNPETGLCHWCELKAIKARADS